MSTGMIVFTGALLAVGFLIAVQWLVQRRMSAMKGQPAPAIPGVVDSGEDAVLFFHSPSCGPCRMMEPHVTALARDDERVRSVDVSTDLETARAYGVMATPTTVLVRGGSIAEVRMGAMPPDALAAMVHALP